MLRGVYMTLVRIEAKDVEYKEEAEKLTETLNEVLESVKTTQTWKR